MGLAATAPCSTSPVQLAACWDQLVKQELGENHQWEERTISGSSTSFVPQVVSGSKLISCMTPTLQCRSCLTSVYAKRPSLLGFYITASWLVPPAFPLDCFMSPACVSAPPSTVQMHYVSTDWSGFCFHDLNMTDISTLESSTNSSLSGRGVPHSAVLFSDYNFYITCALLDRICPLLAQLIVQGKCPWSKGNHVVSKKWYFYLFLPTVHTLYFLFLSYCVR